VSTIKKSLIYFFLFVLALFPSAAFAANESGNLVEELNLSSGQIEQIRQQERTQDRIQEQLQSQIRLREKELKQELLGDKTPNEARIRAMVQEINRLRAKAFEEKVKDIMATRRIMTQEQIRQWTRLQLSEGTGTGSQYQNQVKQGGGASGRDSTGGNGSPGTGGGQKGR